MTVAAKTREAVRARPFIYQGLRAGVINYSAAARELDVGDQEAVAAALRRYAEELSDPDAPERSAQVTMRSGFSRVEDAEGLLTVGGTAYSEGDGSMTAVVVSGDVDPRLLARGLTRLDAEDVTVEAAGVARDSLVVLVDRQDAPSAVRFLEDAV
ncbi:MAG: DUF7523 family protein [Halorhabdus sp.]